MDRPARTNGANGARSTGSSAGAVLVEETRAQASAAGLVDVVLEAKSEYVASMVTWNDPLYARIVARLPEGTSPADFITSLDVSARKPR